METGSKVLEKLLKEHRQILAAVEGLEQLVSGPHPEFSDGLYDNRWRFTRDLLLHFAHDEAVVFGPLTCDTRPHATRLAAQARVDTRAFYEAFQEHTAKWKGFPSVDRWLTYRTAILALMQRLRDLLSHEEQSVYTLLPAQLAEGAVPKPAMNYAAEAWKIRDVIFVSTGLDPKSAAA